MTADEAREKLAEYAHIAWSGWMKYLFSKCEYDNRRQLVIPDWAIDRWKRQAATSYSDMPENEKESDREEADKTLEIIQPLVTAAVAEAENRIAKKIEDNADDGCVCCERIAADIREGVKP